MVAICVDAGTSVVKAVAFDDNGNEKAIARQMVPILRVQPGWSEQDMQAVWEAVVLAIREVAATVTGEIHFLAVTAQGDGCWLIDEAGNPTGPALLWNDGRAAAVVEEWQRTGVLEQAFSTNGTAVFPGGQSALLHWLYEHDRARLERSRTAFYCKDWIILNLTGVAATDESDASFPFLDIRKRQYAPEMLKLYGIEWAQRLLPEIHLDTTPVGKLRPSVAQELGLPAGIPVIAAPYDIAATAIGLGAVQAGQAVSILGTTLCNEVVIDAVDTSGTANGLLICSGVPGRWLRGFATMCGTEALGWLGEFIGDLQPAHITEMASAVEPGAGGVVFLPYLSPAGERAPFLNPYARASIFGLSLEQSRSHVARAILEGLSFVIRECLETAQVQPTELNVCGGGASSNFWCQLLANIAHIPVRTSTDNEVGAKGAFFVGLAATGMEESIESAAGKYVKMRRLYEPDTSLTDRYEELYHHFLGVRDTASQLWLRQANVRQHVRQANLRE